MSCAKFAVFLLLQLFSICAGTHILPPSNVRVSKAVSNGPALNVTWAEPYRTSRTVYGYHVRYGRVTFIYSISWANPLQTRGRYNTTYTIEGLLPGTSYAVSVRTIHDSGSTYSPYTTSQPSRVTTFNVPSQVIPPTVTKAVSSGRPALTVSWSAPQSDSSITKYELQYKKITESRWMSRDVTSTSTTLPYLDAGTEYAVQVRAVSGMGNGPFSREKRQTTFTVPHQVTRVMLSVVSGQAAIRVNWNKPNSDSTIIRYNVQYGPSPARSNGWTKTVSVQGATSLTTTLTGLGRRSYDVRVAAVSDVGFGLYSTTATLSIPRVPSQVNSPAVTKAVSSGRPALTVSWSASQSDSSITKYQVQYKKTPSGDWMSRDVTSTSTTLPNLDAGTEYSVRVRAVSGAGEGPFSNIRKQTTFGVPRQVTGVSLSVVSGQAAIRVNWNKPIVEGTFIRYDVQYKISSQSWDASRTIKVMDKNTVTVDLPSLQRGTTYKVRVKAVSNVGTGLYSASEATITLPRLPSQVNPPTVTKAVSSGRPALTVSWSAPQSDRTITKYELQYRKTPSGGWLSRDVTSRTYTLPNLDSGTEYSVRVRAVSGAGEGPFSNIRKRTTFTVPYQVTGVRLSVVSLSSESEQAALKVAWTKPSSDRPIIRYVVQYGPSPAHPNGWTNTVSVQGADSLTTTLTGLGRKSRYDVRVLAVSDAGFGLYSSTSTLSAFRVPSQVNPPTVTKAVSPGRPALTVSWSAPQSDSSITKYELQYRKITVSRWMLRDVTSRSTTLTNLDAGTEYTVRVRAVSGVGNGPFSRDVRQTTCNVPSTISTPTVSQILSSGGHVLRVFWSRPSSDLTISWYDFGYKLRTGIVWTVITLKGYSSTSTVISNVEQSILYDIRVRAVSQAGCGGIYSYTTGYCYRVPSAPVLTSVQPVVSSNSVGLTVQWTPTTSERPITSYDVEYRSSFGKPRWELRTVGASTTSTTFDSLEQNTTYSVRVAATSDVGTGPPSVEKEASTFGVPSLDEVCAYPLPKPGSVRMAWTRANFTQPAVKLQSYSIQYQKVTEQGGSADFKEQLFNSTTMVVSVGDTVSAEVHGLNLGDVYDVKVALLTNAGIGEYSELVNVTTYPDSCSQCSEIRAVTFIMFQADKMKVSEEQSMVLVDVYRQGPMETPLTLRVKDIPGTAKRGSDYLLQSKDVVFLNTDQRLEKTSIVVRIRNDEVVEPGSPESFTLVLYSDDVDSRVVFTISELTITIKDDD